MSIAVTSQGHPRWSPWQLCVISVMSNIVTVAVLDIFHVKKYDLDFDPTRSSKVKSDGANRKSMDPACKCSRSNLVSVTVFEIFRVKILTLTFWFLVGPKFKVHPRPKFTKWEMTCYPLRSTILQNFSLIAQTVYEICATNLFSLFDLGG